MVLGGAMNYSLHTYNVGHAFEVQDRSSGLLAISLRIRFDFTAKIMLLCQYRGLCKCYELVTG